MVAAFILLVFLELPVPPEIPPWGSPPSSISDDDTQALFRFAIDAERERASQVALANEMAKKLSKNIPARGKERADRLAAVKDWQLRARLMKAGVIFPRPIMRVVGPVAKGQIGVFQDDVHVLQVFGDKVRCWAYMKEKEFILTGLDTTTIVDDAVLDLGDSFECTGSTQFTTVGGGTRSLPTFRKFALEDKVREWEWMRIQNYAEWGGK